VAVESDYEGKKDLDSTRGMGLQREIKDGNDHLAEGSGVEALKRVESYRRTTV
jgi:hypothetical protein